MSTLHKFLSLSVVFLLVACGGQENATPPAADTAGPAPQTAVAPEPATPDPVDAPQAGEPVGESIDEPGDEPADDDTTTSPDVTPSLASGDNTVEAATPEWRYSAGKHYSQLTAAQGSASGAGGVEVTEVFWYGCPHCYSFDPYLARWEDTLADDVRFVRLPVMWNPTNEIHARLFYTAEALGKLGEMHEPVFNALHQDGNPLVREDDIRDFFAAYGVTNAEFDKTFRSFAVESKLKRAKSLTERYRIRSVPVLVINGKYVTDGPDVKSFEDMLSVADELVEKERAEL
ncbi:MAG: DsbA family protein [Gammaproteobacteria bacterium]|nr:DsbA family protein [Gammaproteobacteria bacterium]